MNQVGEKDAIKDNSQITSKPIGSPTVIHSIKTTRYQQFLAVRILIVMFSMMGLSGYWFIRALQRSKESIFALLASNIILHLFGTKNEFLVKLLTTIEPYRYFRRFEIIIEDGTIPEKGCLLPFTPHCIFCFGMHYIMNRKDSPIQNCVYMAARPMLHIAPYGFVLRWWGSVPPDPKNFVKQMKMGKNICWIPGGFEEATMTNPKEYRLFLKQRKGFIKYGLQFGYKVLPVFIFNENKCYKTSDMLMKYRFKLNKFKVPGTIFYSRFGIFPETQVDIYVVIGKAIQLPHIQNPTKELVEQYHQVYIENLKQLFNRHVDKLDPGSRLIFEDEFLAKL